MVGANVHNKVKVSSHCLSNSGTICFDIPKWSGVIGVLANGNQGIVLRHTLPYIHIYIYTRANIIYKIYTHANTQLKPYISECL